MPDSYETALRLIETLRLLPRHPRSLTVNELRSQLADRDFPVDVRTIQRNLNMLSVRYSICGDEAKPQRWGWARDASSIELPGMDILTALAFRLARLHLAPLLPTTLLTQFDPYLQATDRALGDGNRAYRWADKVRLIPNGLALLPPADDPQIVATVNEALLRECCFAARYRNQNGWERDFQQVHPLALVLRGSVLYLLATLDDFEDVRQLRVHRFLHAELLEKQPRRSPEDFDLDTYIKSGGFEYAEGEPIALVALFDQEAARHLYETPLSVDQQLVADDEGDRVRVSATVSDTQLLRWWLLGFGAGVEVLEPPELRAEMAATARQMAQCYQQA
ncbi:MAG: WYL domain-containing protein [Candidatus Competibacteraceae bacterium]|nr:MAG: WYL domain-containing protein [Candidatus Competibacteraceae bacterium]